MSIPYRFLPWARRGLARAHANPDAAGGALATRPRITVGLTLQAKQDGAVATAVSGNIDLTLYGPADIIGIDQRLIVRTDPNPNVTNFEPNYLAIVDFDPPDFPWMLTPARANDTGHLRPWLVLVVVERSKVAPPTLGAGRPLPSISLTAAQVQTELPDLAESWLWAHAQAISTVVVDPDPLKQDPAKQTLSGEMQQSPERNISRLICPRRLKERTDYVACVVPATEGGRLRGLGQPVAGDALGVAWSLQAPNDFELPVYFSWTFSTGPVGDIETLARRLRTPKQYGGEGTFLAQLKHIGQRPVYVDGDHLLFDGPTPGQTVFEGAMVSLGFTPEASNGVYAGKLQEMLNSGSTRVAAGTDAAAHVPTLAPPIYGEYHAKRHTVESNKVSQHWLDGLSLQPRYRLAAGWGAEIVRQNQDEFMQAAWEQLGDVLAAERAFSLARLARDVLKRIEVRHLAKLSPDRVLAVMAPARARIAVAASESLYGRMAGATLPQELFDGSMRRFASPRRATFKMARWRERNLAQPSLTAQYATLVNNFANATTRLAVIDPNRFVPDGILGSRSYDNVPLPADLASLVDLMPYTGLQLSLTGNEIKAIQGANASARKLASVTKKKPPLMGDVWHQGLLTETHAIRVAELQSVAGVPLAGDIGRVIQRSSLRGTEGVLLSVQQGTVTSQALRIDGRNGALKAVGRAQLATHTGKAMRAPGTRFTEVATVPLTSLKLYGNAAVFATLPPSTLGRGGVEVKIGLTGPGNFSKVPQANKDAVPTITMPPAIKDRATLHRYSAAFHDYQRIVAPPSDSLVILQAVDFATAANAAQMRSRVDADRTVPARLASTLSLGGQAVGWAGGALANLYLSTSLDAALLARLRYVVPHTFDRVMAFPHLPFPLSRKLETLAPDVFLPGVGILPDDFIMAVQTNPRFVEALMVGANQEMEREMLWQGMPTDQRGTPFQHFWQRLDANTDIDFIHQWDAVPLGTQPGNTPMLVLLIRGQLLVRVPNLNIYAYKIAGTEKRPGGTSPPPAGPDPAEMIPSDTDKYILPVLRGHLGRDISYIGFPFAPELIDKYFFVIEEHMTEPRFGFDERVDNGQNSNSWQDVDWVDIDVKNGEYFGLKALRKAQPANGPHWVDPHAATVADAALQRPFRGYWRGDALKTPGE